MKRFSQQFNTAAKHVTMTKAESRELKERLTTYMEYHPLPAPMRNPQAEKATIAAEPFWLVRFNTVGVRAFASMTALLALIIVPFAAERAVPGDVLYPVKVQFNEEVRSGLALTPYQQVEWETRRVERRLAEARLLATEGKLTPEIEDEVAAAVKSHGSAAQAGLAKLRETDRDGAAIAELSFASALEVESEVLETESERQKAAGATSTTATIAAAIADVRASVAGPESTDVSFARILAQVEDETTYATELLFSLREEVTDQERADIDRRLADINRKITLAHAANATSSAAVSLPADASSTTTELAAELAPKRDEVAAKQYLREALSDTQKLIRFMTDIDVKANVSVDELVPVTPTDVERRDAVTLKLQSIARQQAELEQQDITDEKLLFGLERVGSLAAQASSSLAAEEWNSADQAVNEALDLLTDMIDKQPESPNTPQPAATTTPETSGEGVEDESATTTAAQPGSAVAGESMASTATTTLGRDG